MDRKRNPKVSTKVGSPKVAKLENRMDLPRIPNGEEDSNEDARL